MFSAYPTIQFPPMRRVTKTLHPSAAAPAPLSNFRSLCGPTSQRFAHPRTERSLNLSRRSFLSKPPTKDRARKEPRKNRDPSCTCGFQRWTAPRQSRCDWPKTFRRGRAAPAGGPTMTLEWMGRSAHWSWAELHRWVGLGPGLDGQVEEVLVSQANHRCWWAGLRKQNKAERCDLTSCRWPLAVGCR